MIHVLKHLLIIIIYVQSKTFPYGTLEGDRTSEKSCHPLYQLWQDQKVSTNYFFF